MQAPRNYKRSPRGRQARGVLGFALVVFLLALGTVPVLAAPTPPESTAKTGDLGEPPAPSPAEVAAVEAKRREEEEWLASPEAAQERQASQDAFAEISAGEARSLLVEAFPEAMAGLNEDPGRVLTGLEVEKVLGPDAALVRDGPGSKKRLLETSIPVQSELGGEGRQPVDLTLERSGDGYVPANPIAELELPGTAEGAVRLHGGLEVRLPADDGHQAVPLGEDNLFIPETEQSTDTLLSPVAGGVEISEQLRSQESSHELTFELELPEGASLKPRGDGGAEVVAEDGSLIEEVPPPTALDAQGAAVPVEMTVEGDDLVVKVAGEGESSYAYPVLVDPSFAEEGTDFGAWVRGPENGYELRNPPGSLNARSVPSHNYGPWTHAHWVYTAPGSTAFIKAATFYPIDYLAGSCSAEQPHGYIGLFNESAGEYESLYMYHPPGVPGEKPLENWIFETGWVGGPEIREAMIGIGTIGAAVNIGCYHELYVGGWSIQLGDEEAPYWNYASGPSSWMKESPLPIEVSATDTGLGMKYFQVLTLNAAGNGWEWASTEYPCNGSHQSPCPSTWSGSVNDYRPQHLPTGEDTVYLRAGDPLENGIVEEEEEVSEVTVKVDHEPPALIPSGSLATHGTLGMGKPEYTLRWKAEDGVTGANQSGVTNVVVKVDGTTVHSETPGCSGSTNCSATGEWNFVASEYGEGKHKVEVIATDAVGNVATRTLEVSDTPEVTSPMSGERTSTRFKLAAAWRQGGYSQITWQYRLGKEGSWTDVPVAQTHDAAGESIEWPTAVEGQESRPFYWNVAASGLSTKDVVDLEVRAVVEGGSNPTGESEPVAAELNRAEGGPKDASSPVGPGNLDLVTGNLSVPRTDVSIPDIGTALEFSRTYNSKEPEKDPTGILGPGWIAGSPVEEAGGADWKSVFDAEAAEEGPYAVVTDLEGDQYPFERLALTGEYIAPPEAAGWKLSKEGSTFVLADPEGNRTEFGTEAEPHTFLPTAVTQPGGTSKTSQMVKTQMAYELTGSNRRLKLLIGPSAEGVEGCGPASATTTPGCRSLSFTYEKPSEWGGSEAMGDRLTSITYNGPTGTEEGHWEVARYAYSHGGRLTEEWDPRIEPPLKETYAYDGRGELRSATPAGQKPWFLGYETEPSSSSPPTPEDTPAATWSFDEGKGTVAHDDTGHGHEGTIESAGWTTEGKDGDALEFDGSKSCVTVPNSEALELGEEFTLEAWVRPEGPIEHAPILFKEAEGENGSYWLGIDYNAAGRPQGLAEEAGITAPEPVEDGVWSNIAMTYDGESLHIYVDGELEASNPIGPMTMSSSGPLYIGCSGPWEGWFHGRIDDVRVYDEALGWGQVREDSERAVESELPAATWSFDEGKGTVAHDDTGHGHEGTIESAGWTTEGKDGDALEFDGSKSCVTVPNSEALELGEEFTLEAWVRPEGPIEHAPILFKEAEGENGSYWLGIDYNAAGRPQGLAEEAGITAPEPVEDGVWSNIAMTYDGESLHIYVDGELEASNPIGPMTMSSSGPLYIGCSGPWEGWFHGRIDDVRVYDEALGWGQVREDSERAVTEEGEAPPQHEHLRLRTVRRASLAGEGEPATAQTTIDYEVPVEGSGAPYAMGKAEVAEWGQKDPPVAAVAIFPPDEVPARNPSRYTRATVFYTDAEGQLVNTASPSGSGPLEPAISTTEPDEQGNIVRELGIDNRLRALGAEGESVELSEQLDTERTYNSEGTELLEEKGPLHEVRLQSGSTVEARLHDVLTYEDSEAPKEEGVPEPHLPTKEVSGAEIPGEEEAERQTTEYRYDWKLRKPTDTIVDPAGLDIQTKTAYDDTTGLPVKESQPSDPEGKGAGTTETVYYSATGSGECKGKPQYAGLPCEVTPVAQAEGTGRPKLLVTKIPAYNPLAEATEIIESPGGGSEHVRTSRITYDSVGRQVTSLIEGGGEAVPKTRTIFSESLGLPIGQEFLCESSCTGFEHRAVATTYDALGRVTEYEDATGNVAKTTYDVDGRPVTSEDAKGTRTITYDPTSGLPTKLEDSGAGTFTATYDAEGEMASRTLPDGLTAETAYNVVGEPMHLAYTKESSCGESCTWLEEGVERSIYGQILTDEGTLVDDSYSYDKDGRLTEAQETPSGGSCTTRSYSYDADSDRTAKTTVEGSGGCAVEGGTPQKYSYDAADRLEGEGLTYDSFGRITTLPATLAGGSKLETTYYSNEMVATQSQGGVTNTSELDSTLRPDSLTQTGGGHEGEEVFHFDGPGDSPAWTKRGSVWTRNIVGLGGGLAAVQESSGNVTFKLTDLHGDVVASASASPTATGLLGTYRFDEFGEPESGSAGRYGWLGGRSRRTELPSGVIQMGVRSYIPQLGRFLTPDPVRGGSANAYDYAGQDPVNRFDLGGEDFCERVHGARVCGRNGAQLHHEVVRARRRFTRERAAATRAAQAASRTSAALAYHHPVLVVSCHCDTSSQQSGFESFIDGTVGTAAAIGKDVEGEAEEVIPYAAAKDAFRFTQNWNPAKLVQWWQCSWAVSAEDGSWKEQCDPLELLLGEPPESAR